MVLDREKNWRKSKWRGGWKKISSSGEVNESWRSDKDERRCKVRAEAIRIEFCELDVWTRVANRDRRIYEMFRLIGERIRAVAQSCILA